MVKFLLLNNAKFNVLFCNLNPPSQTLVIFILENVMLGSMPVNMIPDGCPVASL